MRYLRMEVLLDDFGWQWTEFLGPLALGEQDSCLGSARDVEFLKDGVQITLHGGFAQAEGRGDLFVSFSFGDQWQDSLFVRG